MIENIAAAMATRDLMSAIVVLTELPPDQVKLEYEDIELANARIEQLLKKFYAAA